MNILGLASLALFASTIAALPLPHPVALNIVSERAPVPVPVAVAVQSAPAPFLPPAYLTGDRNEKTEKRVEIVEPQVVESEVSVEERQDVNVGDVNVEGGNTERGNTEGGNDEKVRKRAVAKRNAPLGAFFYEGKIGVDK